jgi:hypothetical protein
METFRIVLLFLACVASLFGGCEEKHDSASPDATGTQNVSSSVDDPANRTFKYTFKNGTELIIKYQLTTLGDKGDTFFFLLPDGKKYRMDVLQLSGEEGMKEIADKVDSPAAFLNEMKACGGVLVEVN